MSIGVWKYVWIFDLVLLINPSVFMPIPCGFYYHSSVGQLEIGDSDTFECSFIVEDCFSYPGFFICVGILMGIALNP